MIILKKLTLKVVNVSFDLIRDTLKVSVFKRNEL